MPNVQHKRGTRSALDALAGAGGLLIGQFYALTDEPVVAIATTVSDYIEFRHTIVLTQAEYDALTPATGVIYVIEG